MLTVREISRIIIRESFRILRNQIKGAAVIKELPEPIRIPAVPGGQSNVGFVIGRDELIKKLWEDSESSSILLTDIRRLGKSSVLSKMAAETNRESKCIKISLQGVDTTTKLCETIIKDLYTFQTLSKRVLSTLKEFFTFEVSAGPVKIALKQAYKYDPLATLETALIEISKVLNEEKRFLLLACDEVPDMLLSIKDKEGPDEARKTLAILRRLRENNPSLCWILTGSVGMHHVMSQIGAGDDLTNDLIYYELGALEASWAKYLADCLLRGNDVKYDPDTSTEIVRITDGIPYLEHLVVAYARDQKETLGGNNVASLFDRAAADLDVSHQSTSLLTRLDRYYNPDDCLLAGSILDELAQHGPNKRPTLQEALSCTNGQPEKNLKRIVDLLIRDHYLKRTPDGDISWKYRSLARIWEIRRAS